MDVWGLKGEILGDKVELKLAGLAGRGGADNAGRGGRGGGTVGEMERWEIEKLDSWIWSSEFPSFSFLTSSSLVSEGGDSSFAKFKALSI